MQPLRIVLVWTLWVATTGCHMGKPTRPQYGYEDMVRVPSGWFVMGSKEGAPSNVPPHRVFLDSFEIDRTEVTRQAFYQYVQATGEKPEAWTEGWVPERWEKPATGILWSEAQAYCRWMGKRLPTEAEWEKSARGTDERRYPWGDEWDANLANTQESGLGDVVPVGSYPGGASPYGALDMCGNAQEWVADYFDPDYYRFSPRRDPQGPQEVLDHVLRGGSWASMAENATTFYRNSSHSVSPNFRVGFRCAADLK